MQHTEEFLNIQRKVEEGLRASYEVPNTVLRDMPQPLVTVRTITYQHAPFIRQCIEGVLMQRTTFPVEYIIGEDCSTDGTREIVMEYAARYPDRIRVITADRNVGVRANARRTNLALRGKYCALCEGDDYWTDPLKLQKQVDFLEANPDVSMVFHNVWIRHQESKWDRFLNHGIKKNRFTLGDVVSAEWFVGTCSMVYRSSALEGVDTSPFRWCLSGDMVLQFHLARKGDFVYMDEVMGVYRRHEGGMSHAYWSSAAQSEAHERHQFEVFRPNHIWMQLAFHPLAVNDDEKKAIERRIGVLIGMVVGYLMHQRSDVFPCISEVRAALNELLEKARPPGMVPDREMYERAIIKPSGWIVHEHCMHHVDAYCRGTSSVGLVEFLRSAVSELGRREYPRRRVLVWMLRAAVRKLDALLA